MKKAKLSYCSKMSEYYKVKEAASHCEPSNQTQQQKQTNTTTFTLLQTTSTTNAGKMEKKRQKQEETISKVSRSHIFSFSSQIFF